MGDFEVVDMNDKLNLLMFAINKINTTFHHRFKVLNRQIAGVSTEVSSLEPRIKTLEKDREEMTARIDDLESTTSGLSTLRSNVSTLEDACEQFWDDIALLKGLVQVQDKSISANHCKIVDLTARSMANNITISNLDGDKEDEDCINKVLDFMRNQMQMEVEKSEVEKAHHLGAKQTAYPRLMVVRCRPELQAHIFGFTKNLKDPKNSKGDYYTVKSQLPEPLQTERMEREERLKQLRKLNDQIPEEEKHRRANISVKNKTIYVNNIPQRQHMKPPTVHDMMNINSEAQNKMRQLDFVHTEPITEKESVFRAHAV